MRTETEIEFAAVTPAQCAARKLSFYMGAGDDALSGRNRDMPRRALNLARKQEHKRHKRRLYGFDD